MLINKNYRALLDEFYARNIPPNASIVAKVTRDSEIMERAIFEEAEMS